MQAVGKKVTGERAEAWQDWLRRYRAKLRAEGLPDEERRAMQNAVNPAYIPRNQLMQRAIEAAEAGDFAPVSHHVSCNVGHVVKSQFVHGAVSRREILTFACLGFGA